MGFYERQILPRVIDLMLRGEPIDRLRRDTASGLSGEVLEVGFGSGRNVPFYPPGLQRVRAVDPAVVGRELAAARVAASPVPIDYIGLDGESLPLPADSVDHVLTTWTLCTIGDVDRALGEIRRVLRPGGELHFVEHGLSPEAKVARLQRRLTPVQRRLFGGCRLDRSTTDVIERAGLELVSVETFYLKGPKFMGYLTAGVARI